jgi:hypothetical protein
MDAGMVVNVVVYPVAPGSSPAVLAEQFFHHCRRIQIVWEGNRCSIEYEGPTGIVRNYSVVLEFESDQFANANQIRRWPREAGRFFGHFLNVSRMAIARFLRSRHPPGHAIGALAAWSSKFPIVGTTPSTAEVTSSCRDFAPSRDDVGEPEASCRPSPSISDLRRPWRSARTAKPHPYGH